MSPEVVAAREMSWNEGSLHRWMGTRLAPRGLAGDYGNDAAVLARSLERAALCTDQVIEGVHYEPGTAGAAVGRKAAGRVLSDLAASGARPRALLLALALGPGVDERWVRALVQGVQRAGREHGAELVGGDLSSAPAGVHVTVSGVGDSVPRRPVGRGRARAGQLLVATGSFGGSGLGRHLRIVPRVAEGRWLAEAGATAMMDVSDGLALDLSRMARASGVRIDLEQVPLHRDARRAARRTGRSALDHALHDGEDHELLATLPRKALRQVLARAPRRCPGLTVIGLVRAGSGVRVPAAEDDPTLVRWRGSGGWVHGG